MSPMLAGEKSDASRFGHGLRSFRGGGGAGMSGCVSWGWFTTTVTWTAAPRGVLVDADGGAARGGGRAGEGVHVARAVGAAGVQRVVAHAARRGAPQGAYLREDAGSPAQTARGQRRPERRGRSNRVRRSRSTKSQAGG